MKYRIEEYNKNRGMVNVKVVVAIDLFKGSMTSMQAGMACKEGILAAIPKRDVVVRPLADGGEGTVTALVEGLMAHMNMLM